MSSITEFPLTWPDTLPRSDREASSRFNTTLHAALKNVAKSLELFGQDSAKPVSNIVLSSNVGGLSLKSPKDAGVAAWFLWDGAQRCIAVDRYPKPEDNLQAIHHILEARRTEMRHGGLHIVRQTFKGFTALPAPDTWQKVLRLDEPGRIVTKDDIQAAYRALAETAHPDKGGSNDQMARLNQARDAALKSFPK